MYCRASCRTLSFKDNVVPSERVIAISLNGKVVTLGNPPASETISAPLWEYSLSEIAKICCEIFLNSNSMLCR